MIVKSKAKFSNSVFLWEIEHWMACEVYRRLFSTMVTLTSNRNIRHRWILCPVVAFKTKFINGNIIGLLATAILPPILHRWECSELRRSCSIPDPTPKGQWPPCLCDNQKRPGPEAGLLRGRPSLLRGRLWQVPLNCADSATRWPYPPALPGVQRRWWTPVVILM